MKLDENATIVAMQQYPSKSNKDLANAFLLLKNEKDITSFLRDLLTPAEILEFSKRFEIAKLLWTTKLPYLEIANKVETSTTTVTRVAQWLFKENWGGYSKILQQLYGESHR